MKGLQEVKILDSKFKWTEPNSMRVRIIIEFKREYNGVFLHKKMDDIEFKVVY